jgi:predicted flap endonuclease-1-like 5' DNA nuclease
MLHYLLELIIWMLLAFLLGAIIACLLRRLFARHATEREEGLAPAAATEDTQAALRPDSPEAEPATTASGARAAAAGTATMAAAGAAVAAAGGSRAGAAKAQKEEESETTEKDSKDTRPAEDKGASASIQAERAETAPKTGPGTETEAEAQTGAEADGKSGTDSKAKAEGEAAAKAGTASETAAASLASGASPAREEEATSEKAASATSAPEGKAGRRPAGAGSGPRSAPAADAEAGREQEADRLAPQAGQGGEMGATPSSAAGKTATTAAAAAAAAATAAGTGEKEKDTTGKTTSPPEGKGPEAAPEPDRKSAPLPPYGLKAPVGGRPDNLTHIRGIGKKIERLLHELGVFHFRQIAAWTDKDIEEIDRHLKFRGRIRREKWVEQARILAEGGETDFARRVSRGDVPTSRKG